MTANENQGHAQRGGQEGYIGRFGQREGEGGVTQLHHNLKNKRKNKKIVHALRDEQEIYENKQKSGIKVMNNGNNCYIEMNEISRVIPGYIFS